MYTRILWAAIAVVGLSAAAWAQELHSPLAKLELNPGDSIVFLGDSITHQRLYTQYLEDYFFTRMPSVRLKLHNAGVGGARAWDALARFDEDVAAYRPKYVTILLGMNDGTYRPYDDPTFQTYRADMTQLLERLKAIGATPVLMTPTMFDARAARRDNRRQRDPENILLYNSVLAYYGTWLRDRAQEEGYGFVDMWSPLNNLTLEQRKTDPAFTMIRDAVHPDPPGQLIMAAAIITDLGLPRQVSTVTISKQANGSWTHRATGGKLSDLKASDDGMAFTWTANSLPWVVPEDAALGMKLARAGHRLSREALEIHGLAPGRYTLTIDGENVGTFTSQALERHIELQENAKTPQYQQAAQVAALNKQRNDGPIGKLRSEWSKFQAYARTKRQAEESPGNADLQARLKQQAQAIEGMAQRVAEHNAAAKQIEDQIFSINQPQPRQYVLRRVGG